MGVLLAAVVVGGLGWLCWLLLRHAKERQQLAGVPCPRSVAVLGHALIVRPDPEGFINQVMGMANLFYSHGLCLFWLGPKPLCMLFTAPAIEPILTSNKHLDKGYAYLLLQEWLGISLLTSDTEVWRPKRKLLTPAFHYDILKDFVPIFNEHAQILVEKLRAIPPGTRVEISSLLTLCALDIICDTSMGRCFGAQEAADSEYVRAIHDINRIVQHRIKKPQLWSELVFQRSEWGRQHAACLSVLHSFTRRVMEEREAELEAAEWKQKPGRRAFLDLLLHLMHEGKMDREDIQPEVDTFMFEGHDTTSTALTWALHLIGNDAAVQKKLHAEVERVLPESGPIQTEHLSQLKYLECVIKESLRLFPSVPLVMRELGTDQEICGHVLPKGTHVLLNQYSVHRDPSQWPDPEVFNPDRFLPENSCGRHSFAFVPFSAGSRNCIGQRFALMKEKVVLASLLRHFNVHSVEKRCEVRATVDLILRPLGGVHLSFEPRFSLPFGSTPFNTPCLPSHVPIGKSLIRYTGNTLRASFSR